jgi:phosphoribosylglycinamide formyltransferase-1
MEVVNIAVFASGQGSNARALLDALRERSRIRVKLILTDRPDAGVLRLAEADGVPGEVLRPKEVKDGASLLSILHEHGTDLIVLAGYFRKIPDGVVDAYRGRILNVHPALLPEFGGKGMYGEHVHRAVLDAGRKESGISIHHVDEVYDHGALIRQETCPVRDDDTPESLAERVKALEHRYYPKAVIDEAEKLLSKA